MKVNRTKALLDGGESVVGCALQQYRSPEIPRLLAAAGFDYLFVDGEHGGFDLETVQDLVCAANQSGVTSFVRVGELSYQTVTRVLDVGAQGVIFPRVEDPALLREAIGWTKYPPVGTRGFGFMAPQLNYEQVGMPEVIEHLNAQTMVVVQFETKLSIERRDELLQVPGVDVAMVGPADLSISLGVPGEFEHPALLAAVDAFVEACGQHKVVPGIHCRSVKLALPWVERGMRFLGCGSEHGMLFEKAREATAEMRAALAHLGVTQVAG